jgi:hypothetical protein
MTTAAVVIPVVQPSLKDFEKVSLAQCTKVLGKWPVFLVSPNSLDLSEIVKHAPDVFQIVRFADDYFQSIADYNRLMTSVSFYEAFAGFDYMLLYQLDAYVFHDSLAEWCEKGYDYVGAPASHTEGFESLRADQAEQYANELASNRVVLNGGLSLRKIKTMLRLLRVYNLFYPSWKGNEDMLFSLDSTRLLPLKPLMKLPDWKTALSFSFEKSPAASYRISGEKLPFGCHAWERYDPAFWEKFIG